MKRIRQINIELKPSKWNLFPYKRRITAASFFAEPYGNYLLIGFLFIELFIHFKD